MNADRVIEVLLGLGSVAVGWLSYRLATRASREQHAAVTAAVDAGAYGRARDIYEGALDTLRAELAETRSQLTDTRLQLATLREDERRLRTELAAVRTELAAVRAGLQPPGN